MKMKLLTYMCVAALTLAVSGCGSKQQETPVTGETETAAVEEAAPAEVVKNLGAEEIPVAGAKPAVIDCWASWCGPCMMFKPVYHKVAEQYADKADFYAADFDQCHGLAELYQITAIPTVVLLKEGQDPVFKTGAMSEDEFKAWLDSNL